MQKTPILDILTKQDIIDILHLDYYEALRLITHAFVKEEAKDIVIIDIFQEGMLIAIDDPLQEKPVFMPFQSSHENFENNVWELVHLATKKTHRHFKNFTDQYFKVLDIHTLTPNILRLFLHSNDAIPEELPGYAWLFTLTQLEYPLLCKEHKKTFSRRYYTLRKVIKNPPGQGSTLLLDIYIHKDSEGSVWAKNLTPGLFTHSALVYLEKTEFTQHGQSLLIADETSLPTIARLLELWKNPIAPIVIVITHHHQEQQYLEEIFLPPATTVHYLYYSEALTEIFPLLDKIGPVDGIWAALEGQLAKKIRHYIRQYYPLSAERCRIKSYWV